MKYLDEQIELSIDGLNVQESGVYKYKVTRQNYEGSSIITNDIFFGNIYLQAGDETATFDITDIVVNDSWNSRFNDYSLTNGYRLLAVWAMPSYSITLTIGSTEETSGGETVFMSYRYPNYKHYMDTAVQDYRSISDHYYQTLLQGRYLSGDVYKYKLIPHYPSLLTNNYEFTITQLAGSWFGTEGNDPTYKFTSSDGSYTSMAHPSCNTPITTWTETLNNLFDIFNGDAGILLGSALGGVDTNFSFTGTHQDNTYVDGRFRKPETLIGIDNTLAIAKAGGTVGDFLASASISPSLSVIQGTARLTFNYTESLFNYIHQGGEFILWLFPTDAFDEQTANYLYFRFPRTLPRPLDGSNITVSITYSILGAYFVFNVVNVKAVYNLPMTTSDITLTIENDEVAHFDSCPSRYYLMWKDRYGSYQSQGFNEAVSFSEKITREQITDYKQQNKLKIVEVLPKWKINSDWIDEELYPFYESLYISPIIILYDTKEDRSYEVLIKSDYTEETFREKRKLISITLDLEENKSQRILY
jgi:hypothetical protein